MALGPHYFGGRLAVRILMTVTANSLLDGINRHILAIASALNSVGGITVAVCTVFCQGELTRELERRGVKIYTLDAENGHSLKILWQFRNVLKDFRPDIIHTHTLAVLERLYLFVSRNRTKIVQTYHGIGHCGRFENLVHKLLRVNVSGYIYVSEGVRQFYNRTDTNMQGAQRSVIYNPIKIDAKQNIKSYFGLSGLRHELGLGPDIKIIGTACRIARIKQPTAFISVMIKVAKMNPGVCGVVIGDGDQELVVEMKQMVSAAGLSERIHLLGYREDAAKLIAEFDVFILTSISEGMPTAVLEAMSAGVPVAFWRGRGGLIDLEMINQESRFGYCVEGDDVDGLAKCVDRLVRNISGEYDTFSHMAKCICLKRFSLDVITKQLISFYRSVLEE